MGKLRRLAFEARMRCDEQGQTSAEYAVVLAVLTIGAAAVFTVLSGGVSAAISNTAGIL